MSAFTPAGSPARSAEAEPRAFSVLIFIDVYPTMAIWSSAITELIDVIAGLLLGSVRSEPLDLRASEAVTVPADVNLVLLISDGACPVWQAPRADDLLRSCSRDQPAAVIHLLPQSRWYRTHIAPTAVQLWTPGAGAPNAAWRWRPTAAPAPEYDPAGEAVPIPVVELSRRWLGPLIQLLEGSDNWVRTAALLVSPKGRRQEDSEGPQAVRDARAAVDEFGAAVTPETFRLATMIAAVPLDPDVIRTLQTRLVPESGLEQLAEILGSSLVHVWPPGHDDGSGIPFRFLPGVAEELLTRARRSAILRVIITVGEGADSPGAALFASMLDRGPGADADSDADSDAPAAGETGGGPHELQWRRARGRVLMALGGPRLREGALELAALPPEPGTSPVADPAVPLTNHDPTPGQTEGPTVSSKVNEPTPATAASEAAPETRTPRTRAVLGDYPLRNPNFTGRGELLADLHDSLSSGETTAVLPHALHGMGGVGKSLLAIEYIYRHQQDYDAIWWISAEQTTRIQSSLMELGQRLGLSVGTEVNSAVPVILDALRRGEPYAHWLLVFDNAESPEQVMPFLPKGGRGHILITSRDARWSQLARALEVNVFTREESKQLLQRRGPDITDEEADRLSEALGDLPLAIEQAAAWHAETGMPAEEYLRMLREKQTELLDQPAPLDYQIPVIAAWNVSLDRLEARSPAALQFLQVCASFAAEPIPRTLLTAARGQNISPELDVALRDPIQLGRALREISRYSLARIDHRTNAIQMHRLVQAALIARMSEEERERMRHAAHLVLAANDPADPENPLEYPAYGNIYPHLLASDAVDCHEAWVRGLVINEAKYLYRRGNHASAVELSQKAHATWAKAHGKDDPQTREIARWLGFFLFSVGRYVEAAELNAETLAVYQELERAGNPDPDGELDVLTNVAVDLRVRGEFGEALAIAERVYDRSLRAYGDNVPETLLAAHDLAVSLRLSGQFTRARDHDLVTYERKVELFGTDHPVTLITRLGLLIDLRELGDYLGAERLHENELIRAQLALGELDWTTLFARRLLAVAQRKAGRHEAARATSELVRSQLRSLYDDHHPAVMAIDSNHAIELRQAGSLDEARRLGSDIVERYQVTMGPDHPHTLSARVNVAVSHRLGGDAALALEIDTAAYDSLVRRLGADHPATLAAAANLGSDHYTVGQYESAAQFDQDAWTRLVAVFGDQHPTTLACRSNLALDLRALGRDDEAGEHHRYAVTALSAALGTGHPAVAEAESWDQRADCDLDPMPL